MNLPPIGMIVLRDGKKDSVALVRIGDEQHVAVWTSAGFKHERVRVGHTWVVKK